MAHAGGGGPPATSFTHTRLSAWRTEHRGSTHHMLTGGHAHASCAWHDESATRARLPPRPHTRARVPPTQGKSLEEVMTIKNSDIAKHLSLPPVKLHCSMLAEDAIKAAVKDVQAKLKAKQSVKASQ
jgi:hypothetical protein